MTDFLPPHLLERLGGLDLIARTVVQGFVSGTHRSPHRGSGDDFARHRPYQQGDEVRYVDWKLFGRTDRLFVREFREESNLRAFLVVDSSLSMGFAGGAERSLTKARYAAYVAAALAHLMLASGDAVGLASFGANSRLLVPPRTRRGHLHELLLQLERLRPEGSGTAATVLDQVGDALRTRGRVILISDLLEEDAGETLTAALSRLRARGDEVIVLRVLTPTEAGERPVAAGRFYDPEHPERSMAAAPSLDIGYRERVNAYYSSLATRFREQGIEYVAVSTDEPVEHVLGSWLRTRRP